MSYGSTFAHLCLNMLAATVTSSNERKKVKADTSGLPPDIVSGLLEYGIDPNKYQLDPKRPNALRFRVCANNGEKNSQ